MEDVKKGDRVGAFADLTAEKITLFGYGVYIGNEIPETNDVMVFGVSAKKRKILSVCILLDSGKKIYGLECWWGHESKVKELEKTRVVEIITIEDYRKRVF